MDFNPSEWQGRSKKQVDTAHAFAFATLVLEGMLVIMCIITKLF